MNIQLQVCGLIMLLLLLVFYKSHKTLNLYSERVFFRVLFITTLTVAFDALSVVSIFYCDSLPLLLVKTVCRVYLSLLTWSAWATLTYILLEFSKISVQRRITRDLGIVALVVAVALFFLPIEIYQKDNVVYTYGTAVTATYITCAVFVLSSFFLSIYMSHKKRSRRAFGGALLSLIWAGAALIQFFNNKFLLVGFSQSLGMLILFVLMENPESYIDKEYGSFNEYGIKQYVDKLYESKRVFFVAQAFIVNEEVLADAGHNVDSIIRMFITKLSQINNMYVFKDTSCGMTFVTTDESSFLKGLKVTTEIKYSTDYLKGYAKLVSLKHAETLAGYIELMDIFAYAKGTFIDKTTEYVDINEEVIKSHKEENDVIKEIDAAIEEDRIEVFLQPIFSNKEKCFTSAEALVRIRLTNGSLLSPGIFIPIAEKTGQIVSLGYKIFEKVVRFISSNDMEELGLHYIEVNLSVMQCEQPDLYEKMMAILEKYNVESRNINFEITESATISEKNLISDNIQKLFDAGFSFSLDDFGKGESNLMYIVDMPVKLIKFDMDFTKAYFDSYKAKSIMRAIIPMAHGLDLELVSEGVETARELELLSSEGIDNIQGYYFSKPIPMPEFVEFVMARK